MVYKKTKQKNTHLQACPSYCSSGSLQNPSTNNTQKQIELAYYYLLCFKIQFTLSHQEQTVFRAKLYLP